MAARRSWLDPRLLIGIALVIASLAGVWLVVQQSSQTSTAWAAARTLLPGETIESGDVAQVDVRMTEASDRYLAGSADPVGLVVAATVGDGELVPLRAVGAAEGSGRAAVVVPVEGALATGVRPGAHVDVWTAAPGDEGYEQPSVLVADAIVVGVVEDEGILRSQATQLELLVPEHGTAALIAAIADEHVMSVVPIATPMAAP